MRRIAGSSPQLIGHTCGRRWGSRVKGRWIGRRVGAALDQGAGPHLRRLGAPQNCEPLSRRGGGRPRGRSAGGPWGSGSDQHRSDRPHGRRDDARTPPPRSVGVPPGVTDGYRTVLCGDRPPPSNRRPPSPGRPPQSLHKSRRQSFVAVMSLPSPRGTSPAHRPGPTAYGCPLCRSSSRPPPPPPRLWGCPPPPQNPWPGPRRLHRSRTRPRPRCRPSATNWTPPRPRPMST